MTEFAKTAWIDQHSTSSTSLFKRGVYLFARPLLSWQHKRLLSPRTLAACRPALVLGPRGILIKANIVRLTKRGCTELHENSAADEEAEHGRR